MIFITNTGQCIELLRKNYSTDTAYYTAIMKLMGFVKPLDLVPLDLVPLDLVPLGLRI
jgi:hypothetical protein